ncbi:MAG: RNA polymerase sigma factor [Chitinophagaceae bacterium]
MRVLEQLDDQGLMKLCRQGDSDGFAELYRRYSKAVFNAIVRLVRDVADAEDLLQEVFVTLYQEIVKPTSIEHFGGFSKRVAVNRAISFLRQQKRLMIVEDYGEDVAADGDAEEEEAFELKVEAVKRAINSLPDGFRTVVTLYLVDGLPQEEIAQLLGVSHATVRTQYHRAKKRILSLLQKEKV